MAIYHLTTKAVSRANGQSSIASAAYRSGEKIENERTGEIADYRRKSEVDHKEIIGFEGSRSELWNKAEKAEKRKDATLAKEYELALPKELNRVQKIELAREYGNYLHERHKVAVDVCIHKIDSDNPHAHILTTTREVKNGNELGDKAAREWSDTKRQQHGLAGRKEDLLEARQKWAECANRALERAQVRERIDHRSLKNQGIEREPQIHVGATATAMERKGIQTERGNINRSRMDLVKLKNEFNQVQAQRVKLGAAKRVQQAQERAHAEKVKSLPDNLKDLEKFKKWEVSKENYANELRVKSAQTRLQRLLMKAESRSKEHNKIKPEAPQGMLKSFKQSSYESKLYEWRREASFRDRRLSQLNRRKRGLEDWSERAKAEATKRVEKALPELAVKQKQLEAKKTARAAEIKREFAEKRKDRSKNLSRGFVR